MVLSDGIVLQLETQHIIALRKALALAVIADEIEEVPAKKKFTWLERQWISGLERELWPGWRDKYERRYPNPE